MECLQVDNIAEETKNEVRMKNHHLGGRHGGHTHKLYFADSGISVGTTLA